MSTQQLQKQTSRWRCGGFFVALVVLLLPNMTFAVEKTVNVIFEPSLFFGRYQTFDILSELRHRGYRIKEDATIERVELLAKARDMRSEVFLQTERNRGYPAQLMRAFDFGSEQLSTFQRVTLTNPSMHFGSRDPMSCGGASGDRWGRDRVELVVDGIVKIAELRVTVHECPDPQWTYLESFRPGLGLVTNERIRVGYGVGLVQKINLFVDKRDIEILKFVVELENGRHVRVPELEGRVRQKSRIQFDIDRRRGVRIEQIFIEAQTLPGQNGRADVSLSVFHQPSSRY